MDGDFLKNSRSKKNSYIRNGIKDTSLISKNINADKVYNHFLPL